MLDHYLHLPRQFLKGFRKIWSIVWEVKKVSKHLKECIRYCTKCYWYHISKIHIVLTQRKQSFFHTFQTFLSTNDVKSSEKFFNLLWYVQFDDRQKEKSSQLFLKFRLLFTWRLKLKILCGRNKYMKKYQIQNWPPFIPQIPDGIKGETFWIK